MKIRGPSQLVEPTTADADAAPIAAANPGRRRLLGSGFAATPVLAIMRSREVLAGTPGSLQCRAVSAYLSATPGVSHGPGTGTCEGRTPGYWQTHPEKWPGPPGAGPGTPCPPEQTGNATCKDWKNGTKMTYFWTVGCDPYASASMMQVLWMQGNEDSYQMGAHLVAAYLNNLTGLVPETVLPLQTIKDMGNAVLCGGQYEAAPGVFWNGEKVVDFLQQTMTV